MEIEIDYADEKLALNLPQATELHEFRRRPLEETTSHYEFVLMLERAEKKLFPVKEAELFVINDAYRPTPTETVLQWIDSAGKLGDESMFLIATGIHPCPGARQLDAIFGKMYDRLKKRIIAHEAMDLDNLAEFGTDSFERTVYLNTEFVAAEKIVIIGSVEPHYFAGFTGGRKSVFPGLCDYDTIVRNHNMASDFAAAPMKLEGNPVHEHLQSLMDLVSDKIILSIQTIPGAANDEGIALVCGDMTESFKQAVALSRHAYGVNCPEKFDLILAEVRPPLDSNLYQLQKSLENCQRAVKDGGTILLFSACREGIGSENFYALADHWYPGIEEELEGGDIFGIHKLSRVEKIGRRINVLLFSELEEGIPDKVYFKSEKKPQQIIDNLIKANSDLRVALVHDAGHTTFANN